MKEEPKYVRICPKCEGQMEMKEKPFFVPYWKCDSCQHTIKADISEVSCYLNIKLKWFREQLNSHYYGDEKQEEPTMKVSYKGVTGELLKLERTFNQYDRPYESKCNYALEIADETDGHKHVFENVDVSEIKFIGAAVTFA